MVSPSFALEVFRARLLGVCILMVLGGECSDALSVEKVEFNTNILDLVDRANIDLSQFSQGGFIMPGTYSMVIRLNQQDLPEQPVVFQAPPNDPKGSQVCLSPELVGQFGLKLGVEKELTWWGDGHCLALDSLKGMLAQGDLSKGILTLSIPQVFLEYIAENWDPPTRWEDGIPGILLDYNLNGQMQRQQAQGNKSYSISGNGTTGANFGPWRLRADWQANFDRQSGGQRNAQKNWEWSRYYVYRALRNIRARLTLGEDYLTSQLFDSFRFSGASLMSDENMLPPNLQGYAPEVTGIARTNAKVTISQQGRVLYETQVAAGPFRIQDINNAVSGKLNVRVEEQNGSVQTFEMDTATIPYLTRPGQVRYKLATGKPSSWQHSVNGPLFAMGEFSWGVNNGWSLYGGGLVGENYNAVAIGVGRDLWALGAIAFDVTQSRALLVNRDALNGRSYRFSYSKTFDDYDSQVTFAGYRFSERNFMSMGDYLEASRSGTVINQSKELYTVSLNTRFVDAGLSSYLDYQHQTYWDRPENNRLSLSLARYFDLGGLRNLSLSLSAYRNIYNRVRDDGMYLSLSMPFGNNGSVSYNASVNRNSNSNRISYYDRIDESTNYQLSAGTARSSESFSGYIGHDGNMAQMNANASYQTGQYASLGISLQGGITATQEGAALHRSGVLGGTRLLVDTAGTAGVPVRGYGPVTQTNAWGKAVIGDMSSYYRNKATIDLDQLGDDAEAATSVVQTTLTEGAIGFRRFDVISGQKAMAVITLVDGKTPPFGATVLNARKQQTGIVNDGGSVYLSGIQPKERMWVRWNGQDQCVITLPDALPPQANMTNLLLPCRAVAPIKTEYAENTGNNE
ncbi:Outer membrane usher protein papC precursor [Serratia quinivorans]|uniref:outer membrane usher protein n=1 Tax=Serratia TaxID=613 RepID=UPI002178EC54|nr:MULTISPECIES: outer membrane usher protein [Serratia]CAI1035154.1 Outer membrane usher protein papC precursor [Serratia quinivorans]CAI1144954.1 Outer membrane usher protein papC precursor [Serratia quinivorans]CAI1176328.1 Outer membrane usher protein papC precursor [Serratia quinivorans]CAI1796666.1 Outer membrane usher protein papC precursor [Serratia quinivorans]CAI1942113.1 Outer membrane usher protein papC precursor [Serratia liquefaciens]